MVILFSLQGRIVQNPFFYYSFTKLDIMYNVVERRKIYENNDM